VRVYNWWEALIQCIEDHRHTPLKWGEWDCCQFAAACVLAMTGIDYRDQFPAYASEKDALRIIAGFGSVDALISSVLGKSKPVAFAKRGDIIMIEAGAGPAVGVCLGVMCAVMGVEQMEFMACAGATAAWSIE
jgi:hypothetical protein